MVDLTGKVALVTGARFERGIGYETALKLAEAGADVVITSRFSEHDCEFECVEEWAIFRLPRTGGTD